MDRQTEKKIFDRLKVFLALEGQQMIHKCSPTSKDYNELGDYYVTEGGVVIAKDVDLEPWAKEMRVELKGVG